MVSDRSPTRALNTFRAPKREVAPAEEYGAPVRRMGAPRRSSVSKRRKCEQSRRDPEIVGMSAAAWSASGRRCRVTSTAGSTPGSPP